MDKEEFRIKLEEITSWLKKDYKGAMKMVDSIDWRRVKNVRTFVLLAKSMQLTSAMKRARKFFFLLITEHRLARTYSIPSD